MNETTQHDPETGELPAAIVPMDLMQRAVTSGASIEVLEKLMALQERYEANQARKAFDAALAAAKAEIKTIKKTQQVNFKSAKGHTQYAYEDMADIAEAVGPALSKHGLSYRYRTNAIGERIAVTCIIAHRDGYSEETTLLAGPDMSGNKSDLQALGSAVTYLQRYTLKAALGLAAAADDDGQASGKPKEENAAPGKYARALEYYEHWQGIIGIATDPAELGARWNEELPERRKIYWPPGQPDKLREEVFARIAALKEKVPAS